MDITQAPSLTQLAPTSIFINLVIASVFGLITALVYKQTHRGVSYSQSYVVSLVLLAVVASMVIMIIGNSLVTAIGLIGAFTIIRFRTAVKETRDLTFMFLSLALGLAAGVGAYAIGVFGAAVVGGLAFALDKTHFGSVKSFEYVLRFMLEKNTKANPYKDIFDKYLKENYLLNVRAIKEGKILELSFNIILKKEEILKPFIQDLSKVRGLNQVDIISMKEDTEY